ncbi:MAG: hypothetical protein IGS03_18730 [Candidatus Sericytochromatia bacterium]|nr:hypothetical protein [Candidatus Sericytochromatia bacterium]
MNTRITQQILYRNNLSQLQSQQLNLYNLQRQQAGGLRYERASQDPLAASVALDLNQALSFQNRLQANAQIAQDFNIAAENELGSAEEIMQRVRELSIRAANEALNEQQLTGMSGELDGLLESLVDLANGDHEGRFIFGGFQSDRPPFVAEKHLLLDGSALDLLGLNNSDETLRTQLETRSLTTVLPGAFALNDGDLIINGVDIGAFYVNDASRSEDDNVQTLIERINRLSDQTGVRAVAVAVPDGSIANPDPNATGQLWGIALSNQNSSGQTQPNGIRVQGKGLPGLNAPGENLPLFRNENLSLDGVRDRSERLAPGDLGTVPAGTISVNGVLINQAITFDPGNSPEQNAQAIATAINSLPGGSVRASSDGYGFLQLASQNAFEITGAPAALAWLNQVYSQNHDNPASTGTVNAAGALSLDTGALRINGIEIFDEPLTFDASVSAVDRARTVASAINGKTIDTGIMAFADNGQLRLSNIDQRITRVAYRGDAGDNLSQIGRDSVVPLYMSGDQAFAGHRRESTLVGVNDLDASGMASLAAGDLILNGVNIGAVNPLYGDPTDPLQNAQDLGNALVSAINAQAAISGVRANLETDNTGAVRLLLSSNGQDIAVSSTPGQEANLLSVTGLRAGDRVSQQIDVFESVIRLRDEVRNSKFLRESVPSISIQNIKEVSDALDVLVGNRVELGVRTQRAELVAQRSQLTAEVMRGQLANNREADLTELISRLTQEETALQASYAIAQRINGLSLLNFI